MTHLLSKSFLATKTLLGFMMGGYSLPLTRGSCNSVQTNRRLNFIIIHTSSHRPCVFLLTLNIPRQIWFLPKLLGAHSKPSPHLYAPLNLQDSNYICRLIMTSPKFKSYDQLPSIRCLSFGPFTKWF